MGQQELGMLPSVDAVVIRSFTRQLGLKLTLGDARRVEPDRQALLERPLPRISGF